MTLLTKNQAIDDIGGAVSGDREISRKEWQQRHGKGFSEPISTQNPVINQPIAKHLTVEEFRAIFRRECIQGSAIDPELYEATIAIIKDTGRWEPNHALNQTVATQWKTRNPHSYVAIAGFMNEDGSLWQGKAFNPMPDWSKGKGKFRKYEFPAGVGQRAFLPVVPPEIREKINQRYSVIVPSIGSFWDWVKDHPEIPIILTEGGKKSLSLLSQGYVAIALSGVNGGYRTNQTVDGEKVKLAAPELIADVARFATKGREITIAFDQDRKAETIRKVRAATKAFGKLLQAQGCEVFITDWHFELGKGVDDALVNQGDNGASWLDSTIDHAMPFEKWMTIGKVDAFLNQIKAAKKLTIKPDRYTTGDRLPELPSLQIGKLTVVEAFAASGKTYQIGVIGSAWKKAGGYVLYLTMLNTLGMQASTVLNIPHIHDYDVSTSEGYGLLCSDIRHRQGIALCYDSLHRIPADFFERPIMLIVDECNQGMDHLAKGETLGDRQTEIVDIFTNIATVAAAGGAIVLAEHQVYPHTLKYVQELSECDEVQYIKHDRVSDPWNVEMFVGHPMTYGAQRLHAIEALKTGKRIIWATTSQANAEIMEFRFKLEFPNKKIVRIDSKTNRGGKFSQFFTKPDPWLEREQPDILILSPSAKTGVSITWAGFDAVYGFFPSLDTDTHFQHLARYRPPVPRYICIPSFIQGNGDEIYFKSDDISQRSEFNREAAIKLFGIEALTQEDDYRAKVRLATMEFYAASTALKACQKAIAGESLRYELERAGHNVKLVNDHPDWDFCDASESGVIDRVIQENVTYKDCREQIWRDDSRKMAASGTYDTTDEALQVLAREASLEDEIKAQKTLLKEEFPGVSFDNADECYWMLSQQRGAMRRGVNLQAAAENLEVVKAIDAEKAEALINNPIGLNHRLPKQAFKALMLDHIGILELANLVGSDVTIGNDDPRCIEMRDRALKYRTEFKYRFGIDIQPEYVDHKGRRQHTPIDVIGKLLRCFNLDTVAVKRPKAKKGEQRDRLYRVCVRVVSAGDSPQAQEVNEANRAIAFRHRQKLLEAARLRLENTLAMAEAECKQRAPQNELKPQFEIDIDSSPEEETEPKSWKGWAPKPPKLRQEAIA